MTLLFFGVVGSTSHVQAQTKWFYQIVSGFKSQYSAELKTIAALIEKKAAYGNLSGQ